MDEKIKDAQLLIRLSKKDLAQIKKNAAACNQTVSSYVRDSALNMCVVPIDVGIIDSYKEEIQGYRNAITMLTYTIKRKGCYTPLDIEFILENSKSILKSHQNLLKAYLLHVENHVEKVEKTVQEIVAKRIEGKK